MLCPLSLANPDGSCRTTQKGKLSDVIYENSVVLECGDLPPKTGVIPYLIDLMALVGLRNTVSPVSLIGKTDRFPKGSIIPSMLSPLSLANPDGSRRTTQKGKLSDVIYENSVVLECGDLPPKTGVITYLVDLMTLVGLENVKFSGLKRLSQTILSNCCQRAVMTRILKKQIQKALTMVTLSLEEQTLKYNSEVVWIFSCALSFLRTLCFKCSLFNDLLPILPGGGGGGKIHPLMFIFCHSETPQAIEPKLSDF